MSKGSALITMDIAHALESARRAFDQGPWSKMSAAERGIYLKKIGQVIRKYAKELAEIESKTVGKTLKHSTFIDVPTAAETFEYFGGKADWLSDKDNHIEAPVKSVIRREPHGVVAAIIPWNYPLIMFAWKVAPALLAGNTVIFKPASAANTSILRLAELIETVGLPEGVLTVVPVDAASGEKLISHPDVNMVSFTGSGDVGRRVMELAATGPKKVILELGGKSPTIVFADCDKEAALGGVMSSIFLNQGQMCTAGSRLFVEEKIYDEFVAELVKRTKALKIGDPLDYETQFGPLVNVEHRDNVLKSIKKAQKEGAKILCGGNIPSGLTGAYIEPTILADVNLSMSVVKDEIFGPVLSVMKFKTQDEVITLANDSEFGLAASIWTKDLAKSDSVGKQLQCGTVWINTYGGFYNEAPFGGYKKSGFGRELGVEGLLEYTQTKHICTDQTPGGKPLVAGWF